LPDASSVADPGTAFSITNTGTGGAGQFQINNAANANRALYLLSNGSGEVIYAYTNGTGRAGRFQVDNAANANQALYVQTKGTGDALYSTTTGTGRAGLFQISNAANANPVLSTINNGSGDTSYSLTTGTGRAARFQISNAANSTQAMYVTSNGSGDTLLSSNTGLGRAGLFQINNINNAAHGVEAYSNGLDYTVYALNTGYGVDQNQQPVNGGAGWFGINRDVNTADALMGVTNGLGYAVKGINTGFQPGGDRGDFSGGGGWFEINRKENVATALVVKTNGRGNGETIDLTGTNTGSGLKINNQGGGGGISAEINSTFANAGYFNTYNPANTGPTVWIAQSGTGDGLYTYAANAANAIHAFQIGINGNAIFAEANSSIGTGNAIKGVVGGAGYAGYFQGTGASSKGVYVSVPAAQPGLNVVSGTKTAIVPTSSGARALYTEESSETWFTDYGFGKLEKGQATIEIDPTFAETVNLDDPYHVFIQAYGDADLFVTHRTTKGFEVHMHANGDPSAEFSYRLVAKRKGHESKRLDRMPFADNDPNLLESKREFERQKH
jgi:hypothetical protein